MLDDAARREKDEGEFGMGEGETAGPVRKEGDMRRYGLFFASFSEGGTEACPGAPSNRGPVCSKLRDNRPEKRRTHGSSPNQSFDSQTEKHPADIATCFGEKSKSRLSSPGEVVGSGGWVRKLPRCFCGCIPLLIIAQKPHKPERRHRQLHFTTDDVVCGCKV